MEARKTSQSGQARDLKLSRDSESLGETALTNNQFESVWGDARRCLHAPSANTTSSIIIKALQHVNQEKRLRRNIDHGKLHH